ncbi:ATP-citrate lyase, putative [Medicago truncatula]|uniref:ATP-citrate lyase, putative n=1 Tax=Medicago truncatula TaxID=3880 RepID=G7JNX4_MEDTR|nr:ATP-citrate lyase, putative [Medicago truncatula]
MYPFLFGLQHMEEIRMTGARVRTPDTPLLHNLIVRAVVEEGNITPMKEFTPPTIPEDFNTAIRSGKVRASTHIISQSMMREVIMLLN